MKKISKEIRTFSLTINNHFPFVHPRVFETICTIDGVSCSFSIKGIITTAILALLPKWWDGCPFNTSVGIAIGVTIGILWTAISYISYKKKKDMLMK